MILGTKVSEKGSLRKFYILCVTKNYTARQPALLWFTFLQFHFQKGARETNFSQQTLRVYPVTATSST